MRSFSFEQPRGTDKFSSSDHVPEERIVKTEAGDLLCNVPAAPFCDCIEVSGFRLAVEDPDVRGAC